MAAIFIESNNTKSIKLLVEMAEHLGVSVNKLSKPEAEKIHLTTLEKKQKREGIISKSTKEPQANSLIFSSLRKRIKSKMTNKQIDQQIKALKKEWQRDI